MNVRDDEYRDLLELWVKWWNGPGRRYYHGNIIPPLTRTADALNCIACRGCDADMGGQRCAACGRLPDILPPGAPR